MAVHWVHNLFLAHVKIAFLIHMREVHNIDMLCSDARDVRMRDHFFFVNFPGYYLPTELVFQHKCPVVQREWLEEHLMLLSRVQIKCHDGSKSMWASAPVMNASSSHAKMKDWKASVRSTPLPAFPYEKDTFMPVACATAQRVDMHELCKIITGAAADASKKYLAARQLRHCGAWEHKGVERFLIDVS